MILSQKHKSPTIFSASTIFRASCRDATCFWSSSQIDFVSSIVFSKSATIWSNKKISQKNVEERKCPWCDNCKGWYLSQNVVCVSPQADHWSSRFQQDLRLPSQEAIWYRLEPSWCIPSSARSSPGQPGKPNHQRQDVIINKMVKSDLKYQMSKHCKGPRS